MVDMDSMYGPMSWLRLHAAGKQVIGLTTAQRTQTDFRLGRPFDSHSFSVLLRDVASEAGVAVAEAGETPVAAADRTSGREGKRVDGPGGSGGGREMKKN